MPAKDRPPSFLFYPRDFMSSLSVAAMCPEARGGYVFLLCHAWLSDRPGWLPDDDEILAGLSGLGERWQTHRSAIARAWRIRKGWWVQQRMVEERHAQIRQRLKKSRSGQKGNEVRWHQGDTSHRDRKPIAEGIANDRFAFASAFASAENQKKNTSARSARCASESQAFKTFYDELWPRRVGRDAAWRKWQAIVKGPDEERDVLSGAERWGDYYAEARTELQYVPHPATWLNQGRWKDEPPHVNGNAPDGWPKEMTR